MRHALVAVVLVIALMFTLFNASHSIIGYGLNFPEVELVWPVNDWMNYCFSKYTLLSSFMCDGTKIKCQGNVIKNIYKLWAKITHLTNVVCENATYCNSIKQDIYIYIYHVCIDLYIQK